MTNIMRLHDVLPLFCISFDRIDVRHGDVDLGECSLSGSIITWWTPYLEHLHKSCSVFGIYYHPLYKQLS